MVQESVMICIDNSEYMRNGDYSPTRMQSQQDAVNLIVQSKLRANPENGVGLLSMADQVNVLSTITREDRKLFALLHGVPLKGESQFVHGLKIAHLALRHRQNRNHKMRIVLFMGSPTEDLCQTETIRMGKKLKKEKVSIDIICFGEAATNPNELLNNFMNTVNNKENSSNLLLVTDTKLVDALYSSPICRGEDGSAAMPMLGAGEFGVDPEEDPELALALRVSLEEQRQRQRMEEDQAAQQQQQPPKEEAMDVDSSANVVKEPGTETAIATSTTASDASVTTTAAVSSGSGTSSSAAGTTSSTGKSGKPSSVENPYAFMTEEEQFQLAMQMSMQENQEAEPDVLRVDLNIGQLMNNPELLRQLIDQMDTDTKEEDKKEKQPDKK